MRGVTEDGLEIRHLTDLKLIRQIYTEHLMRDFPPDECTPWIYVEEMVQKGAYDCYGLFRGEEFLGYAFFLRQTVAGKTYYLFDYLAITEPHRNEGVGSAFLQRIGACIPDADCVLGEVEDPDAAEDEAEKEVRLRRIHFYEQNGFHVTMAKVALRGVVYRMMEIPTGPWHTADELLEIYMSIYRQILPPAIFEQFLKMVEEGERR